MVNGIIGKKLGMTGIYSVEGKYLPVTVIEVGPCFIVQVKTLKKDGYEAVQLGFIEEKKDKNVNKPLKGHFKKTGLNKNFKFLKEFKSDKIDEVEVGQKMSADVFKVGDKIVVKGVTKGRGFAGVIKRHGFSGGPASHGSHSHRIPGAVGACATPSKISKGKKMPGHYGNDLKSILNLKIVDLRLEDNLVFVKGAVPGPVNGILELKKR